jgi:hypothetical protein
LELERGLLSTSTLSPELKVRLDRARAALDRPDAVAPTDLPPRAGSFAAGEPSTDAVAWLRVVRAAEQERRRVVLSRLESLLIALPARATHDTPELAAFVTFVRGQLPALPPSDAQRLRSRLDTLSAAGVDRADAEQASAEFTAALLGLDP